MQTIENIRFNADLYTHADVWTLLLYQQNRVLVAIPLPDAQVMSFIQVFNDTTQCHSHIDTNPRKMITLFAYHQNIQQWLSDNFSIPHNLETIEIFCPSNDRLFFTGWAKRYIEIYRNCTFNVFNFEELNNTLLLFGADLLKNRRPYLPSDPYLQETLNEDYRRICRALGNYFWHEANN